MIRSLAVALGCIATTPALATVCQSYGSVTADYDYVASLDGAYVVVVGRLENAGPRAILDTAGSYRQTVRFDGSILTGTAFAPGWSEEVEVTGLCQGGGCGAHQTGRTGLFFFERAGDIYQFQADVCGGLAHYDPTRADMDAVIQCYRGTCP